MNAITKIDRGIPIPARRTLGRKATYPYKTMECEESFFIAGKKKTDSLTAAPNYRYAPKRFIQEFRTEDGVKGLRVWRIA